MRKTVLKKNWIEYRTKSNNWSKVKHDYEEAELTDEEYLRFVNPDNMWKNDRVTRGYTRLGYKPIRITNVNPCNSMRAVYEFYID